MRRTKFASYCLNGIAEGCKYCVKGEKLVLFITGKCSRNCIYCPLSLKRKNIDKIWANERECKTFKEMIEEAKESNAKGAGITGGDPLLVFDRTLKYASALKKEFGKDFHVHIYLPTKLANKEKLRKLRKYVDEVRFHPDIFNKNSNLNNEIQIIKEASEIFGRQNTGIELPVFPNKKKKIVEFIEKADKFIGFVNLNELEIGDTNFDYITKNYKLERNGYAVSGSIEAGKWVIKEIEKKKLGLKVHLCTAELKNWHQYKNRLIKHKILPFGERTGEGTVVYYAICPKNCKEFFKLKIKFKNNNQAYIDEKKKRIILSKKAVPKLIGQYEIRRVEEYPTFERDEAESEEIK